MNMNRKSLTIGTLLGLILLAGCGPTLTPKEPHVALETVSHPILFAGSYTRMSYNEEDSLAAFMSTFAASAAEWKFGPASSAI